MRFGEKIRAYVYLSRINHRRTKQKQCDLISRNNKSGRRVSVQAVRMKRFKSVFGADVRNKIL